MSDFPKANLGLEIWPYFFPEEIPYITNFPIFDSVLHFGENFMKIIPK